jgi:nicotinamide riboside kinase
MRIAIVGAQNTGKTTLAKAVKAYWPGYKLIEGKYREYVKEKKDNLNQNSSLETQTLLRDFMIDDAVDNASEKYTIFDRNILDNVAYTLWLADKGKITSDEFITSSLTICRETLKLFDVVFWLPVSDDIRLTEEKVNRDTDLTYREEIDYIFQAIYEGYQQHDGILFDVNDQPAMIPLFGTLDERIDTVKQYLDEAGDLIQEESSVLESLSDMADKAGILKQLGKK